MVKRLSSSRAYRLRRSSLYPSPKYYSCRRRRGKCHHLFDKESRVCQTPTKFPLFNIVTNISFMKRTDRNLTRIQYKDAVVRQDSP